MNTSYVLTIRGKKFWCVGPFADDEAAEAWAREFSSSHRWQIIFVPERWMMPIDIISPERGKTL